MSVNYSILPYPNTDDKQQLIDWLLGYDLHVNKHTSIGHFPKLDDFLDAVNSLPDCAHKMQSNFLGFTLKYIVAVGHRYLQFGNTEK